MGPKFVCPNPDVWSQIFQHLLHVYEDLKSPFPPPPMPLILGGWNFSSDLEKNERWNKTIEWAMKHGFMGYIPELKPEEKYCVEEFD